MGVFLSSLIVLKSNLQYNVMAFYQDSGTHYVDEVHTLNYGISSLYSGEVEVLRVGETTRWLARAFYPIGVYYMHSNMGGSHKVHRVNKTSGWSYSSGYVKNNFKKPISVKGDPNLQDFVFAMKFLLGALVILSFLVASYLIANNYGFLAGISYFVFPAATSLFSVMQSIFYTESGFVILFNLTIILALTSAMNTWRLYIWSALILAFAISTKLTGLLFAVPIVTTLVLRGKVFKGMKLEGFVILTILFLALIHVYTSSYMEVIDQTLSNVYAHKTGHGGTQPAGWYQVKQMAKALFPWIFLFPISAAFLCYKRPRNFLFVLSIVVMLMIMLASFSGASFFHVRNMTTPLVMILFVISIGFAVLVRQIKFRPQFLLIASVAGVLILHGYTLITQYRAVDKEWFDLHVQNSLSVARIGIEEELVPNSTRIKNLSGKFEINDQVEKLSQKLRRYDCIVVNRIKSNKQFTNYILPLNYELVARHGNYFVYKNSERYKEFIEKKRIKETNSIQF